MIGYPKCKIYNTLLDRYTNKINTKVIEENTSVHFVVCKILFCAVEIHQLPKLRLRSRLLSYSSFVINEKTVRIPFHNVRQNRDLTGFGFLDVEEE